MSISLLRRRLLLAAALSPLATGFFPHLALAAPASLAQRLGHLERQANGRIGLALLDSGSGRSLHYRGDERFPLCSTFKVLAVAAILHRRQPELQKRLYWRSEEELEWMPVTAGHRAEGMTVAALCAAALQHSDNLAANLLLKELGGPAGLTAFLRQQGDNVTRLDRNEPTLNSAIPGDPRDSSTPLQMLHNLQQLSLGSDGKQGLVLGAEQRNQLNQWLKGNTTGKKAIAAAVPATWLVGDKTGSGDYGTTNDVAVIWRPDASPLVLTLYFTQQDKAAKNRQEVLAQAAEIALEVLKLS
ncbi:class A beta-lactamase [Kalamiella sp. sgz302252]|uniref:class A beta-lactamase n=1 Tax=Pantoea sp. sgz302252 TaxID=3341827 RepID=UPI0036D3D93F